MGILPLGEIAGLLTATCWSFSSILFTLAGQKIGSIMVNRWRLVFAVFFLFLSHLLFFGTFLPENATKDTYLWLSLSGLVGLVIGDSFLFRAYVILGPRSSMILMTLAPVVSSILAFVLLGEVLSPIQILGVIITISGVAWAISHHGRFVKPSNQGTIKQGIIFGVLAAICQASGLILARKGLDTGVTAFSANYIRMFAAMVLIWILAVIRGTFTESFKHLKDLHVVKHLAAAAFIGPFIGVWLSLVAVQYAPVGIASTMMASSPILMIPLSRILLKESISKHSIFGTFLAVIGLFILLTAHL